MSDNIEFQRDYAENLTNGLMYTFDEMEYVKKSIKSLELYEYMTDKQKIAKALDMIEQGLNLLSEVAEQAEIDLRI